MSGPKVSVLTPIYNTDMQYLRECIDSVLNQTFSDFEFIILDNGSEPYVERFVKSYNDPRIKFYRVDKNIGASTGRNLCISHARGKYLAILDSDDVAMPGRLATGVEFLDANPDVGVIGTFSRTTDGLEFFSDCLPTENKDICNHLLFRGNMFCHSSMMLRADVLREHGVQYVPEQFPAEDYSLWLSMVGKTQFALLPQILTVYRVLPNSASKQNQTGQWRAAMRAQLMAIERVCALTIKDKESLCDLYAGDVCSANDALRALSALVQDLNQKNLPGNEIYDMFRGQFKHICYHTHSLGGQWRLMMCPVAGYFGLGRGWRVFCFITRGMFGCKHNVKKDKK